MTTPSEPVEILYVGPGAGQPDTISLSAADR